jgi:serine/threonine protein kinase
MQEGGQDRSWDIRLIDFASCVKDKAKVGHTPIWPLKCCAESILQSAIFGVLASCWGASTGYNFFKKSTKERTFENMLKSNLKFEGQHWKTVSVVLKDLLLRLLAKDMNRRISASEALNHPLMRSTR